LGLAQEIGSLEVGKCGDLAVVSSQILTDLYHPSPATSAATRQRSTPSTVLAAVIGGRVIHPIDFDA
jgi:imidazolonepropionase-like amidohydrolase